MTGKYETNVKCLQTFRWEKCRLNRKSRLVYFVWSTMLKPKGFCCLVGDRVLFRKWQYRTNLRFIIKQEGKSIFAFLSLNSVTSGPKRILDPCRVNFNKLVGTFAKNNVTLHSSHFRFIVCELHAPSCNHWNALSGLTGAQRHDTPTTACLCLWSAIEKKNCSKSEIKTLSEKYQGWKRLLRFSKSSEEFSNTWCYALNRCTSSMLRQREESDITSYANISNVWNQFVRTWKNNTIFSPWHAFCCQNVRPFFFSFSKCKGVWC